jgi:hypothetical protein
MNSKYFLLFSLCFVVVWVLASFFIHRNKASRHQKSSLTELPEPFSVEVVLDGKTVAMLSDRRRTEMFWRSYRIEAVDDFGHRAIADDSLWDNCRFTFRDLRSGLTCSSAFVGGSRPFVRDSRVSIRALYFQKANVAA